MLVYSHDGRVPSAWARSVGKAVRCSGRCAALLSTAAPRDDGAVAALGGRMAGLSGALAVSAGS